MGRAGPSDQLSNSRIRHLTKMWPSSWPQGSNIPTPPPCPSPPLVLPQGGGGRHLLNPKFFVAAHCIVGAQPPPKSAAQSIPVESVEHVQEFKVKWSRTKKIYTELVKE